MVQLKVAHNVGRVGVVAIFRVPSAGNVR